MEQRRRRKQGRSNEVDLAMTLALESFLPEDTTQYYYYQVFNRLFYEFSTSSINQTCHDKNSTFS